MWHRQDHCRTRLCTTNDDPTAEYWGLALGSHGVRRAALQVIPVSVVQRRHDVGVVTSAQPHHHKRRLVVRQQRDRVLVRSFVRVFAHTSCVHPSEDQECLEGEAEGSRSRRRSRRSSSSSSSSSRSRSRSRSRQRSRWRLK